MGAPLTPTLLAAVDGAAPAPANPAPKGRRASWPGSQEGHGHGVAQVLEVERLVGPDDHRHAGAARVGELRRLTRPGTLEAEVDALDLAALGLGLAPHRDLRHLAHAQPPRRGPRPLRAHG